MRVGSLFAGVGGFELAAERAGLDVAWSVEIDDQCRVVLDQHWPDVPHYADVHDITLTDSGGTDRVRVSDVDVLVGGFPCQPFSVAGGRGGMAEDRGELWWQFHRLIAEGRPDWIVGENVPGLLSSRDGGDFASIIDSVADLGYSVSWATLDSQWFGVPQRRRRLFIVGRARGGATAEVLALAEGLFGDPPPEREARSPFAGGAEGGSDDDGLLVDSGVVRALKARFGTSGSDLDDAEAGHLIPTAFGDTGGNALVVSSSGEDIIGSLTTAFGSKNYSNMQEVSAGSLVAYSIYPESGQGADLVASEVGDVAPALTTTDGSSERGVRLVDQLGVRRLTPRECERLQGFPDDWTAAVADSHRYRQMGNAVTVPVVEWILRRLVTAARRESDTI